MNTIGNLSNPPKSFEPVKEVLLQKVVHLTIIAKLSSALLNMIDPVATGVLNFGRKIPLDLTPLDIGYKRTGSIYATDILLE
jgi:hypothetical protein